MSNTETPPNSVQAQLELQKLLSQLWMQAKLKNPAFSMRAFAKKAGLSASALSEILSGKRSVSAIRAAQLLERLGVDPDETQSLLQDLRLSRKARSRKNPANGPIRYSEVRMDEYRLISDWHHFAILSLSETEDFVYDPEWIARRLGIKTQDAVSALKRLKRLEMLEAAEDGTLIRQGRNLATSDGIADLSIRKSHLQILDLAQASIQDDPVGQRDFTAITMAIDPQKIPEARKRIRAFRDELCLYLENGKKKEVYILNLGMFPASRRNEGVKK